MKIVKLNESDYINEYNSLGLHNIIDFEDWIKDNFNKVYVVVPSLNYTEKKRKRDYGIEVYSEYLDALEYAELSDGTLIEKMII